MNVDNLFQSRCVQNYSLAAAFCQDLSEDLSVSADFSVYDLIALLGRRSYLTHYRPHRCPPRYKTYFCLESGCCLQW